MFAVDLGYNRIEREGLSVWHPCRPAAVIATWDPEEGELRPHLLDRLAMHVATADGPIRTARFGLPVPDSGETFEQSNGNGNGRHELNGNERNSVGGNGKEAERAENGRSAVEGVESRGARVSNGVEGKTTSVNGASSNGRSVNGTSVSGETKSEHGSNGAGKGTGKANPWFGLRGMFSSSRGKKQNDVSNGNGARASVNERHTTETRSQNGAESASENGNGNGTGTGNGNGHSNGKARSSFEWRPEAVDRVLGFSDGPNRPVQSPDPEASLRNIVARGREILRGGVSLSSEQTRYLVQEAIRGQCEGHRGEAFAARVAKAHAALRGAREVNAEDLRAAVRLAVLPRSKEIETGEDEEGEGEDVRVFGLCG